MSCPRADYGNSINSITYAKVGQSIFPHDHYASGASVPPLVALTDASDMPPSLPFVKGLAVVPVHRPFAWPLSGVLPSRLSPVGDSP